METCLSSVRAQRSPRLSERLVTTTTTKIHLELEWHTRTCHLPDMHTRSIEASRRAVGWSCEMGRISHVVRRCTRLLSGGRRAAGGAPSRGKTGSKEELEAGKKRQKTKHFQETNERVREMKTKWGRVHSNETEGSGD